MKQTPNIDHLVVFSQERSGGAKKKKGWRHFYRFVMVVLFLAFAIWGGHWIYQNHSRFIFLLKKSKYDDMINHHKKVKEKLHKGEVIGEDETAELRGKYQSLISSYPGDAVLLHYCGILEYELFVFPLESSHQLIADILFERYIDRYKFPETLSRINYQKAITWLRKAIALGLPKEQAKEAQSKLNFLYLFSHRSYFNSVETVPSKYPGLAKADHRQEIIHMATAIRKPNWKSLRDVYTPDLVTYFKAIYYLQIKNRPFGFSLLQKIIKQKDISTANSFLVQNALYLLGYLEGKKRNDLKGQFYFHSQIEMEPFILKNPWFFDDYLSLLRYLGKNEDVKTFIAQYQKLKK